MEKIIEKFRNLKNDEINEGVHIAFEWEDNRIKKIYIGSKESGPILIFDTSTSYYYDGNENVRMEGAWTTIYSRGNYGKKYAYGGNWSGHCKNIHTRIENQYTRSKDYERDIILLENDMLILPQGIGSDITMKVIEPSKTWPIWYPTAKQAMENRLTIEEIAESKLPQITKNHLIKTETNLIKQKIIEVIEAYNL